MSELCAQAEYTIDYLEPLLRFYIYHVVSNSAYQGSLCTISCEPKKFYNDQGFERGNCGSHEALPDDDTRYRRYLVRKRSADLGPLDAIRAAQRGREHVSRAAIGCIYLPA